MAEEKVTGDFLDELYKVRKQSLIDLEDTYSKTIDHVKRLILDDINFNPCSNVCHIQYDDIFVEKTYEIVKIYLASQNLSIKKSTLINGQLGITLIIPEKQDNFNEEELDFLNEIFTIQKNVQPDYSKVVNYVKTLILDHVKDDPIVEVHYVEFDDIFTPKFFPIMREYFSGLRFEVYLIVASHNNKAYMKIILPPKPE
jgi:hypothetical protein